MRGGALVLLPAPPASRAGACREESGCPPPTHRGVVRARGQHVVIEGVPGRVQHGARVAIDEGVAAGQLARGRVGQHQHGAAAALGADGKELVVAANVVVVASDGGELQVQELLLGPGAREGGKGKGAREGGGRGWR